LVDEKPGTTRDYLEAFFDWEGIRVRLLDTAGIHAQAEGLEEKGLEKARERLQKSDLILWVCDQSEAFSPSDDFFFREIASDDLRSRILVLCNKVDLPTRLSKTILEERCRSLGERFLGIVEISARTGQGLAELRERLKSQVLHLADCGEDFAGHLSLRQEG